MDINFIGKEGNDLISITLIEFTTGLAENFKSYRKRTRSMLYFSFTLGVGVGKG